MGARATPPKGEPSADSLAPARRADDRGHPNRVAPPGEARRPLVPDVAYVSNRRLRTLSDEEVEIPPLVYLRAGSSLAIVVDPQLRAVELHDREHTVCLAETGAIEHWALPEFTYPVRELFAVLRRA